MSIDHKPQRGDKVNDTRRKHGNGFVQRILYDDGPSDVVVKFDDKMEIYDYDEFRYTWTDKFGGVFILSEGKR